MVKVVIIVLSAILASTAFPGRNGGDFEGAQGGFSGHAVGGARGFGAEAAEAATVNPTVLMAAYEAARAATARGAEPVVRRTAAAHAAYKPSYRSVAVAVHPAVRHAAVNTARAATAIGFGPDSRRVADAFTANIVAQLVGVTEEIDAEAAEAATVNPTVLMAAYKAARSATAKGADPVVRRTAAAHTAYKPSYRSVAVAVHPAVRHAALRAARAAIAVGFGRREAATFATKIVALIAGDSQSHQAYEAIGAEAAEAATVNPTVLMAAYEAADAETVQALRETVVKLIH